MYTIILSDRLQYGNYIQEAVQYQNTIFAGIYERSSTATRVISKVNRRT